MSSIHRASIVLALVLLAIALPATAASGDPVQRQRTGATDFQCVARADWGTVGILVHHGTEIYAEIAVWAPGTQPYQDGAILVPIETIALTGTETTVHVSQVLVDPDDPEGEAVPASVDLTLTRGERARFKVKSGNGNHQQWVQGWQAPVTVAGTAVVGDNSVAVGDDCQALWVDYVDRRNDPRSFVMHAENTWISCDGTGPEGRTIEVWGETTIVDADSRNAAGDLEYSVFFYGGPNSVLTADGMHWDGIGWRWSDFAPVTARADIDGTRVGDPVSGTIRFQFGHDFTEWQAVEFSGVITIEGKTFEVECVGDTLNERLLIQDRPEGGPNHVPSNDLPEAATPLAAGDRRMQHTLGAAAEAEAIPSCSEEAFPVGRSVWFSVTGTGGSLTLDTAGSSFATVASVHLADGTEIACAELATAWPPTTAQAAVTFPTEAGTTYLVQIAGINGEAGRLRVALG